MNIPNINIPLAAFKGVAGGLVGMGISFVVNSTLAEISINSFFSAVSLTQYFGLLFMFVGGTMVWRVNNNQKEDSRKIYYLSFGCLVVFSGLLCFLVEQSWFVSMSVYTKTPFYAILGTSLSFSLAFAAVDLINYFKFCVDPEDTKTLIDNSEQVLAVLIISLISGLVYGFIFGTLDIEDAGTYQIQMSLKQEEYYCYPIGAIFGIVAGFLVEKYKSRLEMPHSQFDEEIQGIIGDWFSFSENYFLVDTIISESLTYQLLSKFQ